MATGAAQTIRVLTASCVAMPMLGEQPALEPVAIEGGEGLSSLFLYTLTFATPEQAGYNERQAANVDIKQLVGETLTLHIVLDGRPGADGGTRDISGLVTRVRFLRLENRRALYEVVIEPWLTLATRTSDYRIFQDKSVLDIVGEVLSDYDFAHEVKATRSYPPREFQVQYGESDFDFLARLLHEWGLYYYFEHAQGHHKLVIVDDMSAHQPYANAGYRKIPFHAAEDTVREEHCDRFNACETLQSGRWVTSDFDFKRPKASLQQVSAMPRKTAQNGQERYGWPGDYVVESEGEQLVRTRMEEAGSQGERANGSGNLRAVVPGCLITLERHPQDASNREYLVTAAHLRLQDVGDASSQQPFECRVDFELIPSGKVFRAPSPTAPRPRTTGPQTAIVTGPAGREIWTDEYGRVKLSFHWNRYCSKDENSSCWVRVSSPWAGTNFGGIQIPRIGQEVIVDFEHGDPDRPIVTGRVYNADNMPPWSLPANATQSGLLTRSSEGATDANANALRFEDKKGEEQLWLHAEKDQLIEVENDEVHTVGRDRTKTVDNNETNHIKNDRTETVDNNETITIHGQRTETVDANETITVHGQRTETVDGDEAVTIQSSQTHTVSASRTRSVGAAQTVSIGASDTLSVGADRTVSVGASHTESIATTATQNVGAAKLTNVGALYGLNVGAAMSVAVGAAMTEVIGQSKSVGTGSSHSISAGTDVSTYSGGSHSAYADVNYSAGAGGTFDASSGGAMTLASDTVATHRVGGSTVVIRPDSIVLSAGGSVVMINESGVTVNGTKIFLNC